MKYKTFRAIVLCTGLLLIIGGGFLVMTLMNRRSDAEHHHEGDHAHGEDGGGEGPVGVEITPPGPSGPSSTSETSESSSSGGGDWTAKVLGRVGTGISGKKAKDVFKSEPYKLSLYADGGDGRVNRLKVDLDRDGQWDEKWSFPTPGSTSECKRQVSSDDDGQNYDKEFVLTGAGAWQPKGGSEVPAEPDPPAPGPEADAPGDLQPLRPMDTKIIAKIHAGISGKKEKDPWSKNWKVNLYSDSGDGQVTRLKIDIDRDGKWDEKWTIEEAGAKVKRKVSSGDDDTLYDREYRLRGRKWAVKN